MQEEVEQLLCNAFYSIIYIIIIMYMGGIVLTCIVILKYLSEVNMMVKHDTDHTPTAKVQMIVKHDTDPAEVML